MTDISIVIRTKNEGKTLPKTLEGIYTQKIDKTFEIIIVDSGSTDDTLEIAEKFNCKILKIPPEKFTYPYALNFGTQKAIGDIVVYISAHSPPVDDYWLYHLTKHFSDHNVAAVRGRDVPIKGINPVEEYGFLQAYPNLPNFEYIEDKTASVYRYTNGNTAIRKSIWEKYKHPDMICYKIHPLLMGEDQIWAAYLLKKGYKIVYEPQAKVYHSHKFDPKRVWLTSYSPGYFSRELNIPAFPIDKTSKNGVIKYILFRIKLLSIYFISNKYFKAFIFDFPLSLIISKIGSYYGKKDRARDERLFNKSFKYDPDDSSDLSDNPAIPNTN